MSIRSFLKRCIMQFFIISTCICIATALVGPILMPNATLKYPAFLSPPIAALLATLPSLVLYSKRELTLKQTIVRKVLHLLILEVLLTVVAWLCRSVSTMNETLLFMATVFLIYVAVGLFNLLLQNKEAKQINEGLKVLQSRK